MISFSDTQLQQIQLAARSVPVDQRDAFLKLIADQLKPRPIDVRDAIERALRYVSEP
jgi:hypothetical protein